MDKTFFITGGAGFIGSAVIRHIINNTNHKIINIDKLTYAGNLNSLSKIENSKRYSFEKIDICNELEINYLLKKYQPNVIMHLAAESHVDRSINGPGNFINTNIIGTYNLIECAKNYWSKLNENNRNDFIFHHISTDEVYGDLQETDAPFTELTPYAPSSPYSASKASSDHLVRAWSRTYGLPIVVTNCSNNYGPYQYPEKLIPVIIRSALNFKDIPIYGDGKQKRDWLYVEDHAEALIKVALSGKNNDTFNIGGNNELQNIEVVKIICSILDNLVPIHNQHIKKYEQLIKYVEDRKGHDRRYAINATKIKKELNWGPSETFSTGIEKTIRWYLKNMDYLNG